MPHRTPIALLLSFLAACSTRTPISEPTIAGAPPTLIPETGASLYLIEAPLDWLDEFDRRLTLPAPPNSTWIGEQALEHVLRHALSMKEVAFKGQGDFLITSGRPTEVTLTDPESIDAPPLVGFHVKVTASTGGKPRHFDYALTARIVTTDRKRGETAEAITEGEGAAPLRAALVMSRVKADNRGYFLVLRIASLEDP